ncbi:MAG: phosphatidylinositol mannoside acyltransferase [Mycobacteriales bacterium]|nr:MAG: phosphatidylinositol mannoside acyltransferase [Pseudonocardiales bacterium]
MSVSVNDRLVSTAYAAGWTAVKALPMPLAAAGFRLGADIALRRNGPRVRQLRANLRPVVGDRLGADDLERLMRRALRSYARYWLETFRLPAMDHADVAARTHVVGADRIDAAVAAGRGAILALPHMGNWDAGGVWLLNRGHPFTTVAERLRPEALFWRFVAYRERLGMHVLPLDPGAGSPVEALTAQLRAGGVVCLVADRELSANGAPSSGVPSPGVPSSGVPSSGVPSSGVLVSFFGQAVRLPAGPALLAARTGAVLLPVIPWFEGRDWGLSVEPEIDVGGDGRLSERVATATQQLADSWAAHLARRPEDWHMLQPFWLVDRVPAGAADEPV